MASDKTRMQEKGYRSGVSAMPHDRNLSSTSEHMLTRTENLPSVARRMAAGQMLMEGATVNSVADSLHLSAQTVRR
jgi:DNA-binding NarL/FixJ family response regulator